MKTTFLFFCSFFVSVSFLGFNFSIEAKNRKQIKFATLAPKSSGWGKMIRNIARDIYKASNKELILKVFYGGVHGDEKEMEEKIRFKQLDGAFFTGNGLGTVVYESRILEIPGLIQNFKELDYVYPRILDELNIYYHKKGYHLIGLADVGLAYFFSKKDINSIDDIKSTKMWTWKGDRLSSQIMERLKIPAIPVSFTEVIPSLQTSFIDGVYATTTSLISLQWHREIEYMLNVPITLVSSGVVLSKPVWDTLSLKEQKLMTQIITTNLEKFKPKIRKSDEKSLKLLKEQGLTVNPSKENIVYIAKISSPLLKEFPETLAKKVTSLLNEVRNKK